MSLDIEVGLQSRQQSVDITDFEIPDYGNLPDVIVRNHELRARIASHLADGSCERLAVENDHAVRPRDCRLDLLRSRSHILDLALLGIDGEFFSRTHDDCRCLRARRTFILTEGRHDLHSALRHGKFYLMGRNHAHIERRSDGFELVAIHSYGKDATSILRHLEVRLSP